MNKKKIVPYQEEKLIIAAAVMKYESDGHENKIL